MKAEYFWKSDLSVQLQAFLREMRLAGFAYKIQGRLLERLDDYLAANAHKGICLSKASVDGFCYGIEYEKDCTRYKKEVLLSNLALFLQKQGYDAYVCPKISTPKRRVCFEPYIFSAVELGRIFTEIDKFPPHRQSNRHMIDPLLFRLLYGCGLRISEALNLKCKDVDLENGVITILHAKNNKDRIVPVADSLVKRFEDFMNTFHQFSDDETYFFKSVKGGCFDLSTIYSRFRSYLWKAGISHSGNGPRIHDIRHTFSVHCFKKWALSGKDLTVLMPYLAAYLGHTDFRGTESYLRLTADLFPDILQKTEDYLGHIIPLAQEGWWEPDENE